MNGCERLDEAAVFALGALPDEDAAGYATHLGACSVCAARVAELTPVASSLALAVPQLSPSPGLRDRLMREVEAEAELLRATGAAADRPAPAPARRRRLFNLRPVPAVAWSCLVLALGIGGGVVLSGGGDDPGGDARQVRAVVMSSGAPDASAVLHLDDGQGRLVVDGLPAPPEGRIYQVWLDHPKDNRPPEPTDALFSVSRHGRASVDVPGDLRDVTDVLVTDEPAGGSAAPTGKLIISAQTS